ncbi:MAG: sugar transferase, partial [Gemmatimonadota bacterium]|nr:sugar transferase [Gemmatimonadota bacterium]
MATTAAEVTGSDTEFVGIDSPKTTPLRALRLRGRATFRMNVAPLYHSVFEGGSYKGQSTTVGARLGAERTTRALNIFVAALGLLIAAPVFLLVAVAIKLSSRGPVFYKQTRIGLDRRWNSAPSHEDSRINDLGGRPFTMYKFRTMVEAAESDKKEV